MVLEISPACPLERVPKLHNSIATTVRDEYHRLSMFEPGSRTHQTSARDLAEDHDTIRRTAYNNTEEQQ